MITTAYSGGNRDPRTVYPRPPRAFPQFVPAQAGLPDLPPLATAKAYRYTGGAVVVTLEHYGRTSGAWDALERGLLDQVAGAAVSAPDTTRQAVQRALEILGRASADWRNGDQFAEGALHWPVSVSLARRLLRQALEALEPQQWTGELVEADDDTRSGMAWFNSLTPTQRRHWLEVADSAVPAAAWAAFKRADRP